MTEAHTDTERTRTVVRAFFRALQNGDSATMRSLLALDATWWLSGELPTSGTWTGPDQILDEFLAAMFARLDPAAPVTQELHRIVAEDEHAVAEWTSTATTKSGQAYRNDYAVIFRVSGGRIAEVREYFDTGYAQRVMFDGQNEVGGSIDVGPPHVHRRVAERS